MSGPLARQMVTACTRLGDLVIDLDAADHHVVSAALTLGCHATAIITSPGLAGVIGKMLATAHPDHDLEVADLRLTGPDTALTAVEDLAGLAALVVAKHTCPQERRQPTRSSADPLQHNQPIALDVAKVTALLKPGGHLAVVTALRRSGRHAVDPVPNLIIEARRAGLVYLQHIVALRVPARGAPIEPTLFCGVRSRTHGQEPAGMPASTRVHSDLLIFTKPRTEPSATSHASTASTQTDDPVLGEQTWVEGKQA
ncbi:MAG TPA: hypothetical protein VFV66_29925 [Nonomuraea sp.]|nr:hypothetical protein [Nonomuraea sp.]